MIKFNLDCSKSHYEYKNGKAVKYISIFVANENGCFTKAEAETFVKNNTKSSDIENPVEFIYN